MLPVISSNDIKARIRSSSINERGEPGGKYRFPPPANNRACLADPRLHTDLVRSNFREFEPDAVFFLMDLTVKAESYSVKIIFTDYDRQNSGRIYLLSDAENLCAFARFCDPEGKIWSLIEKTDDPHARELIIREAMHCPSGRLVIHDKQTGEEMEHALPPSIGVIEDPELECSGALGAWRYHNRIP